MGMMLITQRCLSCCWALLHRAKGFPGAEDHNAFEWGCFAGLGLSRGFFFWCVCVNLCSLCYLISLQLTWAGTQRLWDLSISTPVCCVVLVQILGLALSSISALCKWRCLRASYFLSWKVPQNYCGSHSGSATDGLWVILLISCIFICTV